MLLLIQIFLRALTQDQKNQIDCEPILWDCFQKVQQPNPTQQQFALFFWHAMYPGTPLEGVALLKDANFIAQVEQAMGEEEVETWNLCGRGSIWDFAGLPQKVLINETLRPVINWKKK